jgi:hypothetical protein
MTHLSILAGEYKDRVTVIGVDVHENKTTEKVKAFVDSMGSKWDYYHVAAEDGNFMETDWLGSADEQNFPASFCDRCRGKAGLDRVSQTAR